MPKKRLSGVKYRKDKIPPPCPPSKNGSEGGLFITFEGPEGSGKTTQIRLLADFLKKKGFKVLLVREPGGTRLSEKIRDILLHTDHIEMSDKCEMLLYMAARAQIVEEVIRPALESRIIVLCDRFLDATLSYQGYGSGMNIALIKKIGNFVTSGIKPDLTILLDISAEIGLKRSNSKDRIENKTISYHKRVRNGYLKLAKQYPERIKKVKPKDCIEKTHEIIRKYVEAKLEI